MKEKLLHLFTRTPMHIGAGASVGAIDLPVVREGHTRFPIIPGSSLKGVLAGLIEPSIVEDDKGRPTAIRKPEALWLFGREDAKDAAAGALLVGEGSLLAFPVRSAKNAFAWLVSPLTLARYARAAGIKVEIPTFDSKDEHVCYASDALVMKGDKVVLEEYTFARKGDVPEAVLTLLASVMPEDLVWKNLASHLVVLPEGMLSFFAENCCEVANRIKIDDFTGTVAEHALFNQENVPSECMFFAVIGAQSEKGRGVTERRTAEAALKALDKMIADEAHVLQIGGDETTGHGFCSVELKEVQA